MPSGRPSHSLIWRRVLSFLLQKDQCVLLQMALLLCPLFCSRHANVLLNYIHFAPAHLPSSSSLLFVGTEFSIRFHYTESDCVKWYIFQEVGTLLLIAAVESILIVRGMLSISILGPFECSFL